MIEAQNDPARGVLRPFLRVVSKTGLISRHPEGKMKVAWLHGYIANFYMHMRHSSPLPLFISSSILHRLEGTSGGGGITKGFALLFFFFFRSRNMIIVSISIISLPAGRCNQIELLSGKIVPCFCRNEEWKRGVRWKKPDGRRKKKTERGKTYKKRGQLGQESPLRAWHSFEGTRSRDLGVDGWMNAWKDADVNY